MKNRRLIGLLGVLIIVITIGFALPTPAKYGVTLEKIEFDPFNTPYAQTEEELSQKRYMLIQFFTLHCLHCKENIPVLNELNKHQDLFVSGYIMSNGSKVKAYVKKHGVEFSISRARADYMNTFRPVSVPMSFLIDTKTLEVKERFIGKLDAKKILTLLAKS